MQRLSVPRILPLLIGLAAVGLAAGCVKKAPTEVDLTFMPEGKPAATARLVVNADLPTVIMDYFDLPPIGKDPGDSLTGTREIYKYGVGANDLMLFDQSLASEMEGLRREANGGWVSYKDFPYQPVRKWLDGKMQVFALVDAAPSSFTPATYMMRGIVGGQITTDSPLSNTGVIGVRGIDNITYLGDTSTADSLFTMSWVSVPGAVGYWLHVYQFLEALQSDQIISGVPAPMYVEKARHNFFGYVTAPNTSYTLGDPNGADIYTTKVTLPGQEYMVRVAAVDAAGRLIAYTFGDFGIAFGGEGYALFPLGAKVIEVRAVVPQPAAALPAGVDLMMGDLPIVFRK